jgi:hypothetical protein
MVKVVAWMSYYEKLSITERKLLNHAILVRFMLKKLKERLSRESLFLVMMLTKLYFFLGIPTSPKKRCDNLEEKIIYRVNISWWDHIYDKIARHCDRP